MSLHFSWTSAEKKRCNKNVKPSSSGGKPTETEVTDVLDTDDNEPERSMDGSVGR